MGKRAHDKIDECKNERKDDKRFGIFKRYERIFHLPGKFNYVLFFCVVRT